MKLLSDTVVAKLAYMVDRAIAGSGAAWQALPNSTKQTWLQYVKGATHTAARAHTYPGDGTTDLGSAARNNAFLAVIKMTNPTFKPYQGLGIVTSFTLSPSTFTHAAGSGTQQLTESAVVDLNGDTVSGALFTYTTDQPTRATVSASGLITIGAATGVAIITATPKSNPTISHICTVTVS